MLTLYWFWSVNPQKVRLALEELGLEYSLVTVDLARAGQQADLVGELNPNHKVPVLRWDAYTIWESNAILTYLGERTHRLWPTDAESKGIAAKWLFFESRHLAEPIGRMWLNGYVVRQLGRTPDTFAQERAEKSAARYLTVLNGHLETNDWMLGEVFSLVDCCYAPLVDALSLAGDYLVAYPAIKAYLQKVRARKAWSACGFRT